MSSIGTRLKGPDTRFAVKGLTAVKPNHPAVAELRAQGHIPQRFGSHIWLSSYLLIDYLSRFAHATTHQHILELGCGWGLPAIYAKKTFDARVTAADADANVFPFLRLLSDLNNVSIANRHSSYADLATQDLTDIDMLIGADICYSPNIADQLTALAHRLAAQGGGQLIVADCGRAPFHKLAERLTHNYNARLWDIAITKPTITSGSVLHAHLAL